MHQFAKQQKAGKNSSDFQPVLILGGSLAGYMDIPAVTVYNTSKFGVRGLLHGLRHTAPRIKARVGMVAPWHVETPMLAEAADYLKGRGILMALIEDVFAAAEELVKNQSSNGELIRARSTTRHSNTKQENVMQLFRERLPRKATSMLTRRVMRSSGRSITRFWCLRT